MFVGCVICEYWKLKKVEKIEIGFMLEMRFMSMFRNMVESTKSIFYSVPISTANFAPLWEFLDKNHCIIKS